MLVTNKPEVSVLLPVHDGEKTLERCIDSVLNQTYDDFEFIIINDNSNDNTPKILIHYEKKDNRIEIIENDVNLGQAKSLNKGIKKAKGKYVAIIDADDWWENNKLEIQMRFIRANPSYGLVGTSTIAHNDITKEKKFGKYGVETDKEIKKILLKTIPFSHSSFIIEKQLLKKFGGYDEQIKSAIDYELCLRLLKETKFNKIQKHLCHRTTHRVGSITLSRWSLVNPQTIKIKLRYYKKYQVPLTIYFGLIPSLLMLMIPNRLKRIKHLFLRALNS
jgi:glycosyltransferase involved in cell wall biosynthesis